MTTFRKMTNEEKNETLDDVSDLSFSDLSFWLCNRLGACSNEGVLFTGKKVTRKLWSEQGGEERSFIFNSFSTVNSEQSGLGKRDCERLWRAVRNCLIKEWRKEMKDFPLSKSRTKELSGLLDRMERVSLSRSLSPTHNMYKPFRDFRDDLACDGKYNTRSGYKILDFCYKVQYLAQHCDADYPKSPTKKLDNLLVTLMRKAMRNVGLNPDSTKIYNR